jgi:arsenite oxidase small subunit
MTARERWRRIKETRRNFLKLIMTFSGLLVVGGVAAIAKSITNSAQGTQNPVGRRSFPRVKVAQLADLSINQPVVFAYPLDNEPNILLKLGKKADGGVGPDGDLVAFSGVCQHLGCIYAFQAPGTSPVCNASYIAAGPEGYCCCHGSVFDFLHGAKVLSGPSPRPQPQVLLEVDESGNVYATGMTPPTIFGHNTGSNDISSDLEGGNPVS